MPERQPIDFFAEPKIASLHKLDLFGKYLTPLTYKWGSRWKRIWLVDGFAGAGAYGEGRGQDGSPLIAAKWAAEVERKRGSDLLHCINVERDPTCFASLQRVLAPWKHVTTNYPGDFLDRLDAILDKLGRDPAFFFLDPFGVNGIEMAVIERILQREGKTELLLHFSDRSFKRMAGHSDEDDGRAGQTIKIAESKLARLDAVIGSRLWRKWWEGGHVDTGAAMEATAEIYLSELRSRGVRFAHQIRMRDSLNAQPPYRLIFATRSPHGAVLMSDLACGYERDLWNAEWDGTFEYLLRQEELKAGSGELQDEVHALGLATGIATPRELLHTLAPKHFAEFRTSDYSKAIRELVRRGGIKRATPTGIKDDEELAFVDVAQSTLNFA